MTDSPMASAPDVAASPPVADASYGAVAIALHWSTALLIALAFATIWGRELVEDKPVRSLLLDVHRSGGILIFLLSLARIAWRAGHKAPAKPPMPRWQRAVAEATYGLFYVALLVMPVTGYVATAARGRVVEFLGLIPLPVWTTPDRALGREIMGLHETGQWVLLALLALHVGAALHHQFIARDDLIRRMWPRRG